LNGGAKKMQLSSKGLKLIKLYEKMALDGYDTSDGSRIDDAFNDFELRAYRKEMKQFFSDFSISSVLDYGCGGSDWTLAGFDVESGQSASEYFSVNEVNRYEPARGLDERRSVECMVSFDVLEHVFISDVATTIRDMLSYAEKLAIVNVACYPARALLPNGENAHITVRPPLWWKGMFDAIAPEFSGVSILLACSTGWRKTSSFQVYSAKQWGDDEKFVIEY